MDHEYDLTEYECGVFKIHLKSDWISYNRNEGGRRIIVVHRTIL